MSPEIAAGLFAAGVVVAAALIFSGVWLGWKLRDGSAAAQVSDLSGKLYLRERESADLAETLARERRSRETAEAGAKVDRAALDAALAGSDSSAAARAATRVLLGSGGVAQPPAGPPPQQPTA